MPVSDKMALKAKCARLKIENYRTMTVEQMEAAIAAHGTNGATVPKGAKVTREEKAVEAAPNKPAAKGKGKTAQQVSGDEAHSPGVDSVAKGKGKATSVTAQAEKELDGADASKRKPAAKGKSNSTSDAVGTSSAQKGKGKTTSPAKSETAQKSAPAAKGAAAKGKAKRTATNSTRKGRFVSGTDTPQVKGKNGYTTLDHASLDWNVAVTFGQSGKRGEILAALREEGGDYEAVFQRTKKNANKWFPTAPNAYPNAANPFERMLRWLIARVAYDYAYKSGQHHVGRAGAKLSTEAEVKARKGKAAPKAAGKAAAAPKGKGKAQAAPAAPKPAAAKPVAAKGKPAAKPAGRPGARAAASKPAAKPAARNGLVKKGS